MFPHLLGKRGPGRYIAPSGGGGNGDSDGGFQEPPVVTVTASGNTTINGKVKPGSFGKFVLPLAEIRAGKRYTFRYTPNFSQLSQNGKLAMVGAGAKNGNDFHIVGFRGDGSTGLNKYKVYGTPPNGWNKETGHTTSDGGDAGAVTQAGPNYIRIEISADGTTYTLKSSIDGTTWTTEYSGASITPFTNISQILTFGVALWFNNSDSGQFSIVIDQFAETFIGDYSLVYLLNDLVYTPSTTIDPAWDAEASDLQGVHSNSVDPSRFVVPSDWNGRYARLQGNFVASGVADSFEIWAKKNGSTFPGSGRSDASDTSGNDSTNVMSAPVLIATADYFAWEADLQSTATLITGTPAGARTWAQIELMPATYSGTLLAKTGNQAISAGTDTAIIFDSETYDPDARHDNSTNNTRINAVSGDALVRMSAGLASGSATGQFILQMRKSTGGGGAVSVIGMPRIETDTLGADNVTGMSAPIAFSSASSDYAELLAFHTSAVDVLASNHTWFCVERLPSNLKYSLAYRNANQALGAGVETIINWNAEVADTDNWHGLADTVSITIATPGVITWTGHNFLAGSPIVLSTTGALPTGLTAGTTYYVVNPASNTFQLATAPGGSAINTTGSQSGVHTATNNSRMSPTTRRARIGFNITTEASMTGQFVGWVKKNGAEFVGMAYAETDTNGADAIGGWSAILEDGVTFNIGDYFEIVVNSAASANIGTTVTNWMCCEEVPDAI